MPRSSESTARLPRAVLFDRDGTLIADVPYNGDPALVDPMPGARALLDELRAAGVLVGIVSNQSAIGRGLITTAQYEAVTARLTELLGAFDVILACPHLPTDGCDCRKPAPGMVLEACRRLEVPPATTVVIGDIGSDIQAAHRAGASGILVPTPVTRAAEVGACRHVARDLAEAAELIRSGAWSGPAWADTERADTGEAAR
ncbi:HAD family hydrolase [Propionimicrobium sp. PCR01-08-3]|uniref:D-glycero-alpha-D-manno-heptose-1,7-bisphosphate 7-phosphatase n=1 Tax=Propionimicrobium sp. PCR01-08-3 TaxID=3052086 RepID=UPI00255C85AA|nr:HAD family hydrolase [Propionimicrobium sp. PCR01-08-3]WIY82173.1 HAD family hydrolase [Propionimicrobium sp. PCR01-08-3]